MKVVQITQDGFVWNVPATTIAKDRATYYAEKDPDTTYDKEYKFTMEDNMELTDWFLNNMNWEDVAEEAKLVKNPEVPEHPDLGDDFDYDVLEVADE